MKLLTSTVLLLVILVSTYAADIEMYAADAISLPPPTAKKVLVLLESVADKSTYSVYFAYLKGMCYVLYICTVL